MPAGCVLRAAQPADEAAIRALVRGARLDPTQLRWAQFWVVAQGRQVIACGQLRRFAGAQELGSLVVAPAWQHRRLGSVLVRHLVQTATAPLYLECRAGLAPYYARFGFVPTGWRALPRALKLKFGLTLLLSTLFRQPAALLHHPAAGTRPSTPPQ